MEKTLLILGNGFDLAHGFPTKYSHFLDFCDMIYIIKQITKNNAQDLCNFFSKSSNSTKNMKNMMVLYLIILSNTCQSKILQQG